MNGPRPKESEVQRAILDYLELRGIFHYRNNSGAFKREDGHFYRFGAVGSPDIVCVIKGYFIGLEVKSPTGSQSADQKQFQSHLEKAGGFYFVVRSIDDAQRAFQHVEEVLSM